MKCKSKKRKKQEGLPMNFKMICKLLALNMGIAAAIIIVFSQGLLGFSIKSANPVIQAGSIMIPLLCAAVFFYGNYSIAGKALNPGSRRHLLNEGKISAYKLDDVARLLGGNYEERRDLPVQIKAAEAQIKSLRKKQTMIGEIFDLNDLSYDVVLEALAESELAVTNNLKKMLNIIILWDVDESGKPEKKAVYDEYRAEIDSILKRNDAILSKVDEMSLEITNFISEKTSGDRRGELELEATITTLRRLNGKDS